MVRGGGRENGGRTIPQPTGEDQVSSPFSLTGPPNKFCRVWRDQWLAVSPLQTEDVLVDVVLQPFLLAAHHADRGVILGQGGELIQLHLAAFELGAVA